MTERAFLFTDIHGCDDALKTLLKCWNGKDLLICMGDSIDRGPNNLGTLLRMLFLRKTLGDRFIYISGNHEDMFKEYFEWMPDNYILQVFLDNGGRETMYDIWVQSGIDKKYPSFMEFLNQAEHGYGFMGDLMPEIEMLMDSMVSHYVFGKALITHAGFQTLKDDWTQTSQQEFCWVRDHYKQPNKTGMVNFFGHTPTMLIDEVNCKNGEIWKSKCGTYIGLDGGGVFKDGRHNAVVIDKEANIVDSFFVKTF